jgi:arylsulfatase A-like enzyme
VRDNFTELPPALPHWPARLKQQGYTTAYVGKWHMGEDNDAVDDSTGRLVDFLRETGQLENTPIVFMGDNGLLEGEHGMVDKQTMHEPSIRVLLVARGPGLPRGKVVTGQVLTEDIAPSILDLCGAAVTWRDRAKPGTAAGGSLVIRAILPLPSESRPIFRRGTFNFPRCRPPSPEGIIR